MTAKNGNSDDKKPGKPPGKLEDWLQLPDSYSNDSDQPDNSNSESDSDSPQPEIPEFIKSDENIVHIDDIVTPPGMLAELDEEPETVPFPLIEDETVDTETDLDKIDEEESVPDDTPEVAETHEQAPEPLGLFDGPPVTPEPVVEEPIEPEAGEDISDESEPADESPAVDDVEYEHHYEVPSPGIDVEEPAPEEIPEDAVAQFESQLALEFRDTLTSANGNSLPVGILMILLSLVGFFYKPIGGVFNVTDLVGTYRFWILGVSTVLALGGIHLLVYWAFHRISNAVKSRELDRLIEKRRFTLPCRHLDCTEPDISEAESENGELAWQCSHFDRSLEGSLICAVCDYYDPEGEPSGIITDDE